MTAVGSSSVLQLALGAAFATVFSGGTSTPQAQWQRGRLHGMWLPLFCQMVAGVYDMLLPKPLQDAAYICT